MEGIRRGIARGIVNSLVKRSVITIKHSREREYWQKIYAITISVPLERSKDGIYLAHTGRNNLPKHWARQLPPRQVMNIIFEENLIKQEVKAETPIEVEDVERHASKEDLFYIKMNFQQYAKCILKTVWNQKDKYGYTNLYSYYEPKGSVVLEYSSPNIAKTFHAGHLRSTLHGDVYANLYKAHGWKVTRINYLGDWGTHIGLLIHGFQLHGDEKKLDELGIPYLLMIYVKMNKQVEKEKEEKETDDKLESPTYRKGLEVFERLENGDEECTRLWKKFRDLTMEKYPAMYKRLGIEFDRYESESMYVAKCKKLVKNMEDKGHVQTDAVGRKYVSIDNVKQQQVNLLKNDGSSLYITRDIAAAFSRDAEFKPDRMHYVVESGQSTHFRNLKEVLSKLRLPVIQRMEAERRKEDNYTFGTDDHFHVQFGRVQGMSTRKGGVMQLEDILTEGRDDILRTYSVKDTSEDLENVKRTAEQLALTGLKVIELRKIRKLDYEFAWSEVRSLHKSNGIAVQYCHARLCSLLKKCQDQDIKLHADINFDLLDSKIEGDVIQNIAGYESMVEYSMYRLEAFPVLAFIAHLSSDINRAYKHLKVLDEPRETAEARLFMFYCAKVTLANAMRLVGIEPLDKV